MEIIRERLAVLGHALMDGGVLLAVESFQVAMGFALFCVFLYVVSSPAGGAQENRLQYQYQTNTSIASLDNRIAVLEQHDNSHEGRISRTEAVMANLEWQSETILGGVVVLLIGGSFKFIFGRGKL